jgi:hypothetical protein
MARSSGIVVFMLAVGLLLAGCNEGRRSEAGGYQGETTTCIEPTDRTTTSSSTLGIDLRMCPKAEPQKLPPDALAGATEAALDQIPSVFGDVKITEGAYALAAYRMKRGSGPFGPRPGIVRQMCRERPQYGERLLERSVEVDLIFPKLRPSASLSQHTVFVARFEGDYWVYGVGH